MGIMEIIESGNAADVRECLTFRLGGEEYGIDILAVREIRAYEKPTRIASAPAFILGVVNLRGVIVPIVDLRIKFGIAEPAYNQSTVVIVHAIQNAAYWSLPTYFPTIRGNTNCGAWAARNRL